MKARKIKKTESLIDKFNLKFPIGSKVRHRNVGIKIFPYKERIVSSKAFLSQSGEPVVFFKGLSSCYSILPEFVDYNEDYFTCESCGKPIIDDDYEKDDQDNRFHKSCING